MSINGICPICGKSRRLSNYSGAVCRHCRIIIEQRDNYYYPDRFYYYHCSEPKPRLYFGIELETAFGYEWKSNSIRSIKDFVKDLPEELFCIQDGSINNWNDCKIGIEIVSHPMTWEYLQTKGKEVWNWVFNWQKNGLHSYITNSCGMHVHITRKLFSDNEIKRLIDLFIYNRKFIEKISQRKLNILELWANIPTEDYSFPYDFETKSVCINLNHSNRIEIRIFRGVLNPASFWKNLEFVKLCTILIKTIPAKKLLQTPLIEWCSMYKDSFPNLWQFITNKIILNNIDE